ncbi:MAG: hypothetical protein DI533_02345 [Cereibacter sphaeroides]|uniref:Uncharacterized protein n=1 Tax=Cereibacter sphaeroides TaxID=1063 RepID=A0A2W5S909_CERSP|nr:MAG: hypothetical protein DI533_02345 [Cereibacter sphaeroides]
MRYGGEELAHHTACNPGETITVKLASMSLTYQAGERSAVATLAPENLIFFNGENRQDLPVDSRTATPFYDKWAPGFVSGGHNKPIGVVGFQFLRE